MRAVTPVVLQYGEHINWTTKWSRARRVRRWKQFARLCAVEGVRPTYQAYDNWKRMQRLLDPQRTVHVDADPQSFKSAPDAVMRELAKQLTGGFVQASEAASLAASRVGIAAKDASLSFEQVAAAIDSWRKRDTAACRRAGFLNYTA